MADTNKKLDDLVGGDTIEINGWIWASQFGGFTHVAEGIDMTAHSYIKICKADVKGIVPPGFNAVQEKVATLDAMIDREKTERDQAIARLLDAKEKLLALPAPFTKPAENFDDILF